MENCFYIYIYMIYCFYFCLKIEIKMYLYNSCRYNFSKKIQKKIQKTIFTIHLKNCLCGDLLGRFSLVRPMQRIQRS